MLNDTLCIYNTVMFFEFFGFIIMPQFFVFRSFFRSRFSLLKRISSLSFLRSWLHTLSSLQIMPKILLFTKIAHQFLNIFSFFVCLFHARAFISKCSFWDPFVTVLEWFRFGRKASVFCFHFIREHHGSISLSKWKIFVVCALATWP